MLFSSTLIEGKFLKRYKRFFADIEVMGEVHTVHTPNTGSMKGLLIENIPARILKSDNPKRKLKYTLQMLKPNNFWVGVNTSLSNDLVWEAFINQDDPFLKEYSHGQREVKINESSRIDFAFWNQTEEKVKKIKCDFSDRRYHFIEVKNVTLVDKNLALFPDSITERGQKHILELMNLIQSGHTAEIIFTIQREDCDAFSPAKFIDAEYAKLLKKAHKMGLKISPYLCHLTNNSISLNTQNILPVILD